MPLRVERRDRVAVLTLVDEERRNALTRALVAEIVAAVDALEADGDVGALVVTGQPPAFCSGADTADLASIAEPGAAEQAGAGLREIYEGFLRIERSSLPTIAAVNGPAIGAGCNLALACDVRLAAPEARFDSRFLRLGIHPGGGHSRLLVQAAGPQTAAAMVLFGATLDGEDAARMGLAWRLVPSEMLLDEAVVLAARAAAVPRELVKRAKASLRAALTHREHDDAVEAELRHQIWSFTQLRGD